ELVVEVFHPSRALGILDAGTGTLDALGQSLATLASLSRGSLLARQGIFANEPAKRDKAAVDGAGVDSHFDDLIVSLETGGDLAEGHVGHAGDDGGDQQNAGEADRDLGVDLAIGEVATETAGCIGIPRTVIERHGLHFPCWRWLVVGLGFTQLVS